MKKEQVSSRWSLPALLQTLSCLMKNGTQLRLIYAKPPQVNKLIGWELTYKGANVRTYYAEAPFSDRLKDELEKTATEKDLWLRIGRHKPTA